jgi:hypothetical protein
MSDESRQTPRINLQQVTGELQARGCGFRELPGKDRIGVIKAQGALQMFSSRAKSTPSFLGSAQGLQSTPLRQPGTSQVAR